MSSFSKLLLLFLVGLSIEDLHISEISSLTSTSNDQGVSVVSNSEGGYMLVCDWQQIGTRTFAARLDDQGVITNFTKAETGLAAPHTEVNEHVSNEFSIVSTQNGLIRIEALNSNLTSKLQMTVNVGNQTTAKSIAYNSATQEFVALATTTPANGHGGQDIVVVRISGSGNCFINGKVVGGAASGSTQNAFTIINLSVNSGYIVTASTQNSGGGILNSLIIRLDNSLNLVWGKIVTGANPTETPICAEFTTGDLAFVRTQQNLSTDPALFVKATVAGSITLARMYQHSSEHIQVKGIVRSSDGNLVMAGNIGTRILLMKIDQSGSLLWSKSILIHQEAVANSISRASTGSGFIITGKTVNNGNSNVFVMQVDSDGSTSSPLHEPQNVVLSTFNVTSTISLSDLPASSVSTLSGTTYNILTPEIVDTGFTQTFLFPSSRSGASNPAPASELSNSSSVHVALTLGGLALTVVIVIVIACCCNMKRKCIEKQRDGGVSNRY